MQNKLADLTLSVEHNDPLPADGENSALVDALLALEALGYAKKDTKRVEKELTKQTNLSTAEYVSAGLKLLQ